ncbi:hypothetical protein JAAARDRAFT_49664 [Jaapia argillacea MUCL 33604]|uniref:Uncharacterized protein n=1 Tax=Jaapia argillacea MUCL 33604 TaxID=933084 RepID=A0A067PU11_9AGAM|nr:hypothetical protein JAAARDRAFT_49664 [Jaapia argillacea MUCL 33604]
MLAPSIETSCEGIPPLVPSTPICIIGKLMDQVIKQNPTNEEDGSEEDSKGDGKGDGDGEGDGQDGKVAGNGNGEGKGKGNGDSEGKTPETSVVSDPSDSPIKEALTELAVTSTNFLFTSLPLCVPLDVYPTTELERKLQEALQESENRGEEVKAQVVALQASVVLQTKYIKRAKAEPQSQEQKKSQGKNSWLVGDGLLRLLTGDVFYEQVVMHQLQQEEEEEEEEARESRLKWNWEKWATFQEKMAEWKVEQAWAKRNKKRPWWRKPVLGAIEGPVPQPTASTAKEEDQKGQEVEEDEFEDSDDDD